MTNVLYASAMRQADWPNGLDHIAVQRTKDPSCAKKADRSRAISTKTTQANRKARKRNWKQENILAGGLEHWEALETVKQTVVGDGRRTLR